MRTFWQIWLPLVLLGLLIIFGLLSALLGVGVWHWLSWIALIIPIVVMCWFSIPARKR